jgi:uncharacterized membrane protein YfcA
MFVIGFIISLAIGVILGLVGGGGSILTLPVVNYFFDVSMLKATTYSLFIVGISSGVGVLRRLKTKEFSIPVGLLFVVPSTLVTVLIRSFVLPSIPAEFELGSFVSSRDNVMSGILIVVMVYTAVRMLTKREVQREEKTNFWKILMYGALTGSLAGFIGAGGGFIIVPLLVKMGINLRKAVGTSMLIIFIQCSIAMFADTFNPEIMGDKGINVPLLGILTLITIGGVFIGTYYQKMVNGVFLRKLFAIILLLVSVLIFLNRFAF